MEASVGLLEAVVLGIVQGLTEFLPISSSAHLVLVPAALGWAPPPLVFDSTLHLGTLMAVVAVFWSDLLRLARAWGVGLKTGKPMANAESRLAWWVILGTAPATVAGVLFGDFFESLFANVRIVGIFLLVTALLLTLAEAVGRGKKGVGGITWADSLLVGIGQAAAIAPGLSRSGTTISVGMFRNLTREAAVRFSFLLSIPIIAGAGLAQFVKLAQGGGDGIGALVLVVGFLAAAASGYVAIRFLLAYLRKRTLYPFAVYCGVVGLGVIILLG